jgi:N12 class adenine-specific DNA methylase
MSNYFDQFDAPAEGGNYFDQFDPQPEKKKTRTAADIAGDIGVTALKGAVGLPQAIVGLADIPTGGRVGKALEDAGYRPGDAQQALDAMYSDPQQEANAKVRSAEGFTDTMAAAIENPSVIATTVGESLPQMLGGAGIARGLMKGGEVVGKAVAPWLAGAVGEGALGAGSAAEQIRGNSADGLLTPQQSAAAAMSGVGTAVLGAAGGKLANKLGLGDVDTLLAQGGPGAAVAGEAKQGFIKQIVGSGISEGVFEELPQSIQEQMWQNYAEGKPLTDGVGNAAALGLLSGAVMGGAGGGYNAAMSGRGESVQGSDPLPADSLPGNATATAAPATATAVTEPTEAEKALTEPKQLTALDRVNEIDGEETRLKERLQELDNPESGYGEMFNQERQDIFTKRMELSQEREQITQAWPKAVQGTDTQFSTEAGVKLSGKYALIEASDLQASHDTNLRQNPSYPPDLQPRERDRAASEMQISAITQKLDPARLGESADAANGAPIVGADGLVESGNARTIALQRIYQANGQKAADYRQHIADNAARYGLAPEQVAGMKNPVLVRVRTTPVNRAEFARQANASTVAAMSPSEQARSDAARMDDVDGLTPDENGDFTSGTSRDFVRRFMAKLPGTEQAGMIDAAGNLSQTGYTRIRNAVMAKAYGDSPVLLRMTESLDDNMRNITKALMQAAPTVAQARQAISEGALHDSDITPDLVAAVEELSRLKDDGVSLHDALAQAGMFGDQYSPETRELLQFLADNTRRPRKIAEFITAYFQALNAAGNPAQGSLLGDTAAPAKGDLLTAAKGKQNEAIDTGGRADIPAGQEAGAERRGEPGNAPRDQAGAQGDGAAERQALKAANDELKAAWDNLSEVTKPKAGTLNSGFDPVPTAVALVRLFKAAFTLGTLNAKAAARYVLSQINTKKEYAHLRGKVDKAMLDSAAKVALDEFEAEGVQPLQGGLFDGADNKSAAKPMAAKPAAPLSKATDNKKNIYRAYTLTDQDKAKILKQFPPTHSRVIADHISAEGMRSMDKVKDGPATGEIVGHYDQGGIQALAVRVNGTDITSDGSVFHITVSAESGVSTRNVGDDMRESGYSKLANPMPINLTAGPTFTAPLRKAKDEARAEGETDKAFAKRIVDKRAAPASLPEDYGLYFNMDGAKVVPIADLVSTKTAAENEKGSNNGAKRMAAAAAGELSTRAPITVMPSETAGKYEVVDGNGTLASVSKYGWKSLPVQIVSRETGLAMIEKDHAADAAKAGKPQTWEERSKGNYKVLPLDKVVPADVAGRVSALVEKWKDNLPEATISEADRIKAESMLTPLIASAQKDEAWFDERVKIAAGSGIAYQFGPTKKVGRAAVKLVSEKFNVDEMKDIVRATIVVNQYDDAQGVLDAIAKQFKVLQVNNKSNLEIKAPDGAKLKNKGVTPEGYSDVSAFVALPGGGKAEIQINTPEMLAAKDAGHILYEGSRVVEGDPARKAEYEELRDGQLDLYRAAKDSALTRLASETDRRKYASSELLPLETGAPGSSTSSTLSSSNRNQVPSGNLTNSSPPKDDIKAQPLGNLSGTSISTTSNESVAQAEDGKTVYDSKTTKVEGKQDERGKPGETGTQGQGAGAAAGTDGERQAQRVPDGQGGPDTRSNGDAGAGNSGEPGVQQGAEDRPNGSGGDSEYGDGAGAGAGTSGNAGVPASRDIPLKSGRNYAFGDTDLTYEGSWRKKAEQNVEAVELLKKLEADGRQATRDEQAVLAKFIGWGSSEIANSIFGDKLDKQLAALDNYDLAMERMGKNDTLWRGDRGYYEAFAVVHPNGGNHWAINQITRAELAKARPSSTARKWGELRDRLKAVMTDAEWADAARSTQNAHYTSKGIVKAMWRAAERMGFKGGSILEPGSGIGVFPGLLSPEMATNSVYTGIEMDTITGGILKQLFPDERILVESFIDSQLPEGFYDMAAGNPPFAAMKVLADPKYKKYAFSLHDYFFAKTVDSVKPGGIVEFVTSRFSMDKLSDKARAYIAERADLVGAIRLPQTAFKQNAGTDVVTDVLFLRVKVPGETFEHAQPWAKSVPLKINGRDYPINEYFHAHPEMVLGKHADSGKMANSPDPQYTVEATDEDIESQFDRAVLNLPENVYQSDRGSAAEAAQVREIDFNPKAKKEGNFYVTDAGVLMQREGGVGLRVELKKPKDEALIKDYVGLRDALKQAHYDQLNDGDWGKSLDALRTAYAGFVAKHGQVNQFTEYSRDVKVEDEETGEEYIDEKTYRRFPLLSKLDGDPDYSLVSALETIDGDTGVISESKFLTERVLGKPEKRDVKTPSDALLAVLNDTGKVDPMAIAERLGMSEKDTIAALGSLIFNDPSAGWVMADEYLSGNVKKKLRDAQEAAKADRKLERNVEALLAVQPAPVPPSDIAAKIGMNWIPEKVYEDFLREITGVKARVHYNERTGQWAVEKIAGYGTNAATADWGTNSRDAADILLAALTSAPIRITKTVGSGKDKSVVLDQDATEAANQKRKLMRDEFSRWLWQDGTRTDELVQLYNDKFNTIVPRAFDGRHLTLPGTSKQWKVFAHVKRGAWRIIQSGNTYLAHAVGSGKAQPLDAKVLTPEGWRLMGDLQVGDMVIAADGSPTMVEAVFPQGAKDIFRVEFSDGSATECCEEHLWLTQTYRERSAGQRAERLGKDWPSGRGKVRSLREIADTLIAPHLGAKNHSIPIVGAVQFAARPVPIDPYVMGALLGDGCFVANSVMLSSADADLVEEVRARLPAGCELVHRTDYDYGIVVRGEARYANAPAGGGIASNNPVLNAVRDMGLKGLRSHEKHVPIQYLFNAVEARIALLQGLLDTDGGVEGGGTSVRFSTTSERLADDVTALVRSLGGVVRRRTKMPTFAHKGVRKIGRPSMDLCISLPPSVPPFRLQRKANATLPKTKYQPVRYITAVTPVGRKSAQCIRVAHPSHLYVTDDFIVTHNTFQMVIAAMEQKRLGLVKKPMMVVPNHMLQQFAREWQDLYPAARLMVADEKNFNTENRRRFVSRVALSDLDGVIITHSAFKLLDLDPEFKRGMIEQELDFLRAALSEAEDNQEDGKRGKSPKVKQIEAQIEKMEQKLKAAMSGEGKDKNVRFDELGVDQVFIDEAHEFRKLSFTTQRQVKGISPGGSDRAFDLWMKTRWLEQKNPGRSLVMASGTPVTNTLAELYSVQRFMANDVLVERGIEQFDDWASMFGDENTEIEADASGKYSPVTRFTKFLNVPELTQMFREYADVLTSDHLAVLLGDKRPKVNGGSRKLVITEQTKEYSGYKQELARRIDVSRRWKPSKDEPNNPDPIIKIIGDGRLAAIDMRFVDPSLPSNPESKLNRLIDNVIRVYKESSDIEYRGKSTEDADGNEILGDIEAIKGAAQMVFSDLGFGAGVAASRGFNARAWFEKRMREAGIPASHVAFMSDFKKSTDKLKLFKDVNAGRVRILVGSSKNMGTGVNAQQRLIALSHLDTPWYPADLEQREGRIIRQGNKNPSVQVYAFSTKGSYDAVMWQMLASKQRFIDQALSGDSSVRSIDDVSESSQYQIATAMTSDDPRAIQLAGLNAEIEKLQRLYRAHEEQRGRQRQQYALAGETIAFNRERLAEAEDIAKRAKDLSGDKFKADADGKTYTSRKEWGEALLKKLKNLSDKAVEGRMEVGVISGFPVIYAGRKHVGGLFQSRIHLALPSGRVSLAETDQADPVGMAARSTNAIVALQREPEAMREKITRAEDTRNALESRLHAPFEFAGMLADKMKEAIELGAAMLSDQNGTGSAGDTRLFGIEFLNATTMLSKGGKRGGISVATLEAVRDRIAAKMENLPPVHVFASPLSDGVPLRLRSYIANQDAIETVEGAMHDGAIYLFASGLADEARAEFVLAEHEVTHYGLRGMLGKDLNRVMQNIWMNNARVRKAAARFARGTGVSQTTAVEEVLADMTAEELTGLRGWRKLVGKVRDWMADNGFTKTAEWLNSLLNGTLTEQARADAFVADLVRRARKMVAGGGMRTADAMLSQTRNLSEDMAAQEKWLTREAKARGYKDIDDLAEKAYPVFEKLAKKWRDEHQADVMLSRGNKTAAQRADEILSKPVTTWRPLDAIAKAGVKVVGFDRATRALYHKAGGLLDALTPEVVKAGMIADYGLPGAVLDQRAMMQGRMNVQMRKTGKLIDKLATLTRAESRVAYEWMNNDDPQAAAYFEQQLPPESLEVMNEVKKMIDQLSQEAVRLGQLDAETFKKNRFAYLRRSYVKHTAELTKGEAASRRRAIAVMGDQYKARGITDGVDMKKVQNIAPEWWKRKLQAGKADKGLKGEKFIRLERRAHTGEGTVPLEGMGDRGRGRLLEVAYWPAGEQLPGKYKSWNQAGTWEVRDTKGGKLMMWRDFTKQERTTMGEIDEARYAIAKTLHGMIQDVETGRYLRWLAETEAKIDGDQVDGVIIEASERMRDTFKPGEWVKVPDTKIPGTSVLKYGKLAGRYLPGPVWNDVRQVVGGHFKPLGDTYAAIHRAWKTSKTALSPAVHTNNIMANFVMADWHDVTAGHIAKALRILLAAHERDGKGVIGRTGNLAARAGIADREASAEIVNRFRDSGGTIGTWATTELQKEQLLPILEALEKELGVSGNTPGAQVGAMVAMQKLLQLKLPSALDAFKPTLTGRVVANEARNLISMYEAEDQVFRLAAWLKAKGEGQSDLEAGKVSRRSFLDYHINAPWVQMMRGTALPFVAFTYRAVPMLLETAANKPWKLLKLGLVAGVVNALAYAALGLGGGDDEDDERRLLPDEKAGKIWGMVPKLIRMPWNDKDGAPVFLDVRRFVPVGDVFDTGATNSALPVPPAMIPGGPLALFGELAMNKAQFTGRPITLETDTASEKAGKIFDHVYKAFAPNILILPGTYAWTAVKNASTGKTDSFGREQSTAQAMASSFGVKLASYPRDVLQLNAQRAAQAKMMEIDRNITALKREYQRNGIDEAEFTEKVQAQQEKKLKIVEDLREKL